MIIPNTDNGVRPAGDPNKCFYCSEPKGSQHKNDCVVLTRTIVVKLSVEYVVETPILHNTISLARLD